jgi:transcriptional regulator with XRE-family HTH domain
MAEVAERQSSLSERLAWRIRDLRVKRDLSQTELAKVLGVRQTAVSAMETRSARDATFNLATLQQVAWALDVDLVVELRERV